MRPDAQLSDRDLFGFVLETGFSTVEQVTKIAGRGYIITVRHGVGSELGPIAGRNFVHGFTASIVLFRNGAQSKR